MTEVVRVLVVAFAAAAQPVWWQHRFLRSLPSLDLKVTPGIAARVVLSTFVLYAMLGGLVAYLTETVAWGSVAIVAAALVYVYAKLLVFDLLRLRRGARLLVAGRSEAARAVFAKLVRSVRRHGPIWATLRVTQQCTTMLLRDAPDEGVGYLEQLLVVYPQLGDHEKCLVQHAIAHARLLLGQPDRAAAILANAAPPQTPAFGRERQHMLARVELLSGRPEAALDQLAKVPDDKVSETLRAHALVALRQEDQAREILLRLRRDHGDKWLEEVALFGGPAAKLIEEIFGKAAPKAAYR